MERNGENTFGVSQEVETPQGAMKPMKPFPTSASAGKIFNGDNAHELNHVYPPHFNAHKVSLQMGSPGGRGNLQPIPNSQ